MLSFRNPLCPGYSDVLSIISGGDNYYPMVPGYEIVGFIESLVNRLKI
jgi:hypothetical protein